MSFSRKQAIAGLIWVTALGSACGGTVEDEAGESQPVSAFAEEPQPAGETLVAFGEKPGQLVFDASGSKVAFKPLSTEPLKFASWEELGKFAQEKLNAEVTRDPKTGLLVGVGGTYTVDGAPFLPDEKLQTVHELINPVGAYLGGLSGYIFVGSQRVCVRPEVCEPNAQVPVYGKRDLKLAQGTGGARQGLDVQATVATGTFCNSGGFCVRGDSWNWHFLWHNVGSFTERVSGGTREDSRFCWMWGFIPWVCTTQSGEPHNLFVATAQKNSTLTVIHSGSGTAANAQKVERGAWAIGAVDRSSPIQPTAAATIGSCGRHSGSTGSGGGTGTRGSSVGGVPCP